MGAIHDDGRCRVARPRPRSLVLSLSATGRAPGTRPGRRIGLLAAAALIAAMVGGSGAALAVEEPRDMICAIFVTRVPLLSPIIHQRFIGIHHDAGIDCLMWQTFIYLNWPANPQSPGEPDWNARFNAPGPTVWETYKRHDEVFLPNAAPPAPWGVPAPAVGSPRHLVTPHQADGNVLVDRAGRPVHYEMLMNRDEFDYLVRNRLYDADVQLAVAQSRGVELPAGATAEYGTLGAIEVKAAWKVLTREELRQRPIRFHTAEAVLADGAREVMGLVGLHIYQRVSDFRQGTWASFVQVDNAPLAGTHPQTGQYSFYDPSCAACAANAATEPPAGTQVEQVFPTSPTVRDINDYVRELFRSDDPASPWQFYEMLGAQWPRAAVLIGAPGEGVPLPDGTPNMRTLMNPVLETFQQAPNVSCIGCHARAATAKRGDGGPLAASYSYLLRHAQSRAGAPSSSDH